MENEEQDISFQMKRYIESEKARTKRRLEREDLEKQRKVELEKQKELQKQEEAEYEKKVNQFRQLQLCLLSFVLSGLTLILLKDLIK